MLFLPASLLAYWSAPARARIGVLLAASYVFYLSWQPAYGLLLAGSTVVNYLLARRLAESRSRRLLAAGVAFNVAVLVTFKYAGLLSFHELRILLPLAI